MKKHFCFFLILLGLCCERLRAQSYPAFDLYQYNYSLINPAYTGNEGSHKFSATGRGDNLGDTRPYTSWMLAYEAFIPRINSGVGVIYTKDNVGPYINQRYGLTYSYHFTLPDSSQLGLGINSSLDKSLIDFSRYRYQDPFDPISRDKLSDKRPSVGVGMWYKRKNWFAGFSVDYLNRPTFFSDASLPQTLHERYQITLGYQDFQLGKHLSSTHSLNHSRYFEGYFTDWNNTVAYRNLLLLGLGYRLPKAGFEQGSFRINGGVRISSHFQLMSLVYMQKPKAYERRSLSGELLLKVIL
jgi:type IX secretion system PorP/SprF family membrane protein